MVLGGSIPVRVYVLRKVVDEAFSVKPCDLEFGFPSTPCDPEQSGRADLRKAAGKMCGAVRVVVEGARGGELAVRGALMSEFPQTLNCLTGFKVPFSVFFSSRNCCVSSEPSR